MKLSVLKKELKNRGYVHLLNLDDWGGDSSDDMYVNWDKHAVIIVSSDDGSVEEISDANKEAQKDASELSQQL